MSFIKNHTARQIQLHTPAGIATKIWQEQLEEDVFKMSRICIELQIALNEERQHIEFLSMQDRTKFKKEKADEAASLRKELKNKTRFTSSYLENE